MIDLFGVGVRRRVAHRIIVNVDESSINHQSPINNHQRIENQRSRIINEVARARMRNLSIFPAGDFGRAAHCSMDAGALDAPRRCRGELPLANASSMLPIVVIVRVRMSSYAQAAALTPRLPRGPARVPQ